MSGFQGHDRDFSQYDHMSTEELEEILRADFELPEEEESDMEKILYITEVIARRRAGQPTGRYADADGAWASFVENYLPAKEQAVFRQEENISVEPKNSANGATPRRRGAVLLRVASVAAAILLVVTLGAATASAFGFDLWAWFTAWTQEAFGLQNPNTRFNVSQAIPDQLTGLHALMQEYGFPDRLLPTYLPEGYEANAVECESNAAFVKLHCFLNQNDDFILFEYTMYLTKQVTEKAQKDEDDPNAYERGGVTHYIMMNDETCYAVWTVDNVECLIHGVSSYAELIRMINSIYGGNT